MKCHRPGTLDILTHIPFLSPVSMTNDRMKTLLKITPSKKFHVIMGN